MTKVRAIQQEQTTNGGHARNGIGHLQRFQGKNIFWCTEEQWTPPKIPLTNRPKCLIYTIVCIYIYIYINKYVICKCIMVNLFNNYNQKRYIREYSKESHQRIHGFHAKHDVFTAQFSWQVYSSSLGGHFKINSECSMGSPKKSVDSPWTSLLKLYITTTLWPVFLFQLCPAIFFLF